jgi:hypothetical protein
MKEVQTYELRDKTTCFYDPETGLEVTRDQQVEIGSVRGKLTIRAIQHSALIEVSPDTELESVSETSTVTATTDKTKERSVSKPAARKSAQKKPVAAKKTRKGKTEEEAGQPTNGASEQPQTESEPETSGETDKTAPSDANPQGSQE